MRVLFVQHGDYREAVNAFRDGRPETYHDQRFTVDFVGELAGQADYVGVVCLAGKTYDERLGNGVHAIGMPVGGRRAQRRLIESLDRIAPTHLILRTPLRPLLAWALAAGVTTLPLLADSFEANGLRGRWNNHCLQKLFNDPQIAWVANHNLNAARSLARIGVDANKIIPFEYESRRAIRPDARPVKQLDVSDGLAKLIYVGTLTEAKGLPECLQATKLLKDRGYTPTLTVVGSGDEDVFRQLAGELGIDSDVNFTGRLPHERIIPMMREHHAVLIPSRHEYAEALPGTIVEAFCSRTPPIVSDHPMFAGRVVDGQSGLVFPARQCERLADCIERLLTDGGLYHRLSESSQQAWLRLQCPVGWGELITRFLRNDQQDRQWLAAHSLASYPYL